MEEIEGGDEEVEVEDAVEGSAQLLQAEEGPRQRLRRHQIHRVALEESSSADQHLDSFS